MRHEVQPGAGALDAPPTKEEDDLQLTLRRQMPKTTGYHGWQVVEQEVHWRPSATAIISVDMWEVHPAWGAAWGAAARVNVLAPRINTVISAARARGVQIIHAPSDVVDVYQDHAARRWIGAVPPVAPPALGVQPDPPLPIDGSGGAGTREDIPVPAYSRQHPAIEIVPEDAISADAEEIYSLLVHKGIDNVIYMGIHTNWCVLARPFGIKHMVQWRSNVVLARDLTDAVYDPLKAPYISHDEGTDLVIGYIEKFWCPTLASDDLTASRG